MTSKLGLLPILLPDDRDQNGMKNGLENDKSFQWGAQDITDQIEKLDLDQDNDDDGDGDGAEHDDDSDHDGEEEEEEEEGRGRGGSGAHG